MTSERVIEMTSETTIDFVGIPSGTSPKYLFKKKANSRLACAQICVPYRAFDGVSTWGAASIL
jgi:hypothetical protein